MCEKAVDLAQLRRRLAKLGVHIAESDACDEPGTSKPSARAECQTSWTSHLERNSKEVAQLLDRCNKVHQVLCQEVEEESAAAAPPIPAPAGRKSVAAAAAAVQAAKSTSIAAVGFAKAPYKRHSAGVPGHSSSSSTAPAASAHSPSYAETAEAEGRKGSSKLLVRAAQKLLHDAQAEAQQVNRALILAPAPSPAAQRAAARGAADDHRSSPLGTVLAQFKEAQAAWAQEKAQLRREAVASRKKASKLELELAKLQRLHQHKTMDVSSLKAALKGRDQTLEEAQGKIKQLGEALTKSNEVAAEKLCSLAAERDDLQALLLATLERLEGVEAVVAAADATSASMEEKVQVLEGERMAALEAAAAARAEVSQLREDQRRLQWQTRLLEKMSEVQLRHNKRKSAAIKDLLMSAAAGEVESRTAAAGAHSNTEQQPADVLEDMLQKLLHEGHDSDNAWVTGAGRGDKDAGTAKPAISSDSYGSVTSTDGDEADSLLAALRPMLPAE